MTFLTGDTRSRALIRELRQLGWGRMVIERRITPYPREPWGFDNGAFGAWNNAVAWDGREYLDRLAEAGTYKTHPFLAVVPDKVADPDSLRFSLGWRERVDAYAFPWFLAVQDGMGETEVAAALRGEAFAGVFLGGTKRWKRATAARWLQVARRAGVRAHYARCSGADDLRHAQRLGYDSADSAFILWTRERFATFARLWGGSPELQGSLFS